MSLAPPESPARAIIFADLTILPPTFGPIRTVSFTIDPDEIVPSIGGEDMEEGEARLAFNLLCPFEEKSYLADLEGIKARFNALIDRMIEERTTLHVGHRESPLLLSRFENAPGDLSAHQK